MWYYTLMKNGRNTAGQFAVGNTGRPKGSRNKATIAIEGLLHGQAEALTQTAGQSVGRRQHLSEALYGAYSPCPKGSACFVQLT